MKKLLLLFCVLLSFVAQSKTIPITDTNVASFLVENSVSKNRSSGPVLETEALNTDNITSLNSPSIGFLNNAVTASQLPTSNPFITTWKTDNPGPSDDNTIVIPTFLTETYNYAVDWGDGTTTTGEVGNATHSYAVPGTYTVSITGLFPRIYFTNTGDREKIVSIEQWGDNPWSAMGNAFSGCTNLVGNFTDVPNLANVTNMTSMFSSCEVFNSNINNWDVSTITAMNSLFEGATLFNQPLNNWDVSNVLTMSSMFRIAREFNQNINNWDVSSVNNMGLMFGSALKFNQPLDNWNVSSVTSMRNMFNVAVAFNQDINNWDVSNVVTMTSMFRTAIAFNQSLENWNVSNVTNMSNMFQDARAFNQDIGNWNVANVTNMSVMFASAWEFNQNIGSWQVGNVTGMRYMFSQARVFNQNIGNWDVSNVTDMRNMFSLAFEFNQDIGNWDVSNVTNMNNMFFDASMFNQDIGNWNVGNVTEFENMFEDATSFNQDIGNWNVENVTNAVEMFRNVALSTANYDALLIGWNSQNLQPNVTFSGGDSQYCEGEVARANIITSNGWTITDDGIAVPTVNALANQNEVDTFTFPVITGGQLTGSEAYYTAPNGGGTRYDIGDTINFADLPTYPVTLYIYDGSGSCASEQSFELVLTESATPIPNCTNLTIPSNGSTNVSIITDLTWTAIANADGYFVTVGTSSGGNDILDNEDVTGTTFNLPADLPENMEIFVTIIPYNGVGNATGCTEESFTTETLASIPNCTTLTSPFNGSTDVSIATDLTWTAIANADGYFVTVGTSSGGVDILDNFDVGNFSTYNLFEDLPENTEIFVSITPYNGVGDAIACPEERFTTETSVVADEPDNTKYGFSPDGDGINEFWEIDNIENYPDNTVTIYNRWGDIVFSVKGYNNTSRAFRGNANRKTNMGADKLPSGTYFFLIEINGSHNLKKTKGFVVLKR